MPPHSDSGSGHSKGNEPHPHWLEAERRFRGELRISSQPSPQVGLLPYHWGTRPEAWGPQLGVFPRLRVQKLRCARRGSFPMTPLPPPRPTNQASELLDPGGPSPLVGYTFPIGGLGALGTRGCLSRSYVA